MAIKDSIRELHLPSHVQIVAATKGRSIPEISEAISAGVCHIGENYVQEAEEKLGAAKGKAKIHLIGHLQTNKAGRAVRIFDMIQAVDSEKIAIAIGDQCKKIHKQMEVLIEVNIAEEKNKSGCPRDEVEMLAAKISRIPELSLKGLMTVGPSDTDAARIRPYFRQMKQVFDSLKKIYPNIDTLSMGMSDSYKVAIEEGATMVRLGRILFGKRA